MMDNRDIGCIKNELLNFEVDELSVLEWGAGFSTLYFTRFLADHDISFRWDAIEHDPKWYFRIHEQNELVGLKIHFFIEPNPADKEAMAIAEMKNYINCPRMIGRKYDVIIVDGRQRNKCLGMAQQFIKEDGVIFLHDAQRERHREIIKRYKGEHLTKTLCIMRK